MQDWKKAVWLTAIFLAACFLPLGDPKWTEAILEAFRLLQWYALHHTLACVVPAMFIAGAISVFLSKAAVMRHLGAGANPVAAYGVASVAGVVLAVCSCSVLPMFAGIYAAGAGLGPASAFLYSGPAINVMAVFLSARVLGTDIGVARALGAVIFAVVIGLLMAGIFRRSEQKRVAAAPLTDHPAGRPLWQTGAFFAALILFLVFADWYNTNDVTLHLQDGTRVEANIRYSTQDSLDIQERQADGHLGSDIRRIDRRDIAAVEVEESFTTRVFAIKWYLAAIMGLLVLIMSWRWFSREELGEWMVATWDFGLMIIPLLFGGVFFTGFVGKLIPETVVAGFVGGEGLLANVIASFAGMLWYFATLTEIPIVEMLTRLGMGRGPALALLLAGPALSVPSILVVYKVLGGKKTLVFSLLTVAMSTVVGFIFGQLN
jgi:uncharacterized membrane protein YraQ (UPF0718 family)